MGSVNVHEAKTHLSRLLEKVAAGEEIVISKRGKPVARLCPIDPPRARVPGLLSGKVGDEFFDPLPDEELEAWEG
jgi:prevent-host-death family protein